MIASEVIESMGSLTGDMKCLFPKSDHTGAYVRENALECQIRALNGGGANAVLVLNIKDTSTLIEVLTSVLTDTLENVDSSNVTVEDFFKEVKGPLIDAVGFPGQAATINMQCGDFAIHMTTGTLVNNDHYFEYAVSRGDSGIEFERTLLRLLNNRRCGIH